MSSKTQEYQGNLDVILSDKGFFSLDVEKSLDIHQQLIDQLPLDLAKRLVRNIEDELSQQTKQEYLYLMADASRAAGDAVAINFDKKKKALMSEFDKRERNQKLRETIKLLFRLIESNHRLMRNSFFVLVDFIGRTIRKFTGQEISSASQSDAEWFNNIFKSLAGELSDKQRTEIACKIDNLVRLYIQDNQIKELGDDDCQKIEQAIADITDNGRKMSQANYEEYLTLHHGITRRRKAGRDIYYDLPYVTKE